MESGASALVISPAENAALLTETAVYPGTYQQRSSADELVSALACGKSAVVIGFADSASLLDGLGKLLARTRTRVMRVNSPLGLPDFMEQLLADNRVSSDLAPEAGFQALTVPGDGYERIALLVDEAHLMPDSVRRYLDFAFRAAPNLQVVLAGRSGLADVLALQGFSSLRARFELHLDWSGMAAASTVELAAPAAPDQLSLLPGEAVFWQPRYRMMPLRLLAGALASASLAALVAFTMRFSDPDAPVAFAHRTVVEPVRTQAEASQYTRSSIAAQDEEQPSNLRSSSLAPFAAGDNFPAITPAITAPTAPPAALGIPVEEPEQAAMAQPTPPPASSGVLEATITPSLLQAPNPGALSTEIVAGVKTGQEVDLPLPPVPPPVPAPQRARAIRTERVAARAPVDQQSTRCRAITLRMQVGDTPTDSERSYLQNGCR